MRIIAQAMLILGGGIGLLASVPMAIYGWMMHRGFGGDLSAQDRLLLYGPLYCPAALIAGIIWRNRTARKNPRDRFKLTGDPGSDGGGGDGGSD